MASARDRWAGGPLHPEKRLAPHQGSLDLALDWPSCEVLEPWHPQALAKKPLSLKCDSCRFGKNVPASMLWFTQLAVSEVGRTDLSLGDSYGNLTSSRWRARGSSAEGVEWDSGPFRVFSVL